tara:strand:- start:986 stop:1696 length:711 start_codon:yes stop_codon:yes gene_type:complete
MKISEFKKKTTAIILCGGRGERLKPLTNKIPKPLIKVGGKEILSYIINHLFRYNINDCLILSGYKKNLIKKFLENNFKSKTKYQYTGEKSDIIERINKSLPNSKKYLMICYGDTLLDININKLIKFHMSNNKLATMSVFNSKFEFGVVKFNNNGLIKSFSEKPDLNLWINVGYFIFEKEKFKKLFKRFNSFEKFLFNLCKIRKFQAFKHMGRHITINTTLELENAKKQINKLKKNK